MATFLIDLSPGDMQRRLADALGVYVDAMRYPRGTEDQRASMWLEHTRRHGLEGRRRGRTLTDAGDASSAGEAAGRGADASGSPTATAAPRTSGGSSRWSPGLQRVGADRTRIAELMTSYFELTELHIHPRAQGRGLGEALARRLLAGRDESHVLLSTPEINGEANRAWRLYRRLGFTDVIRGYHFAGDPRAFAILGRSLPL